MIRTEHVLNSWKAIRQETVAAVEEFPAGEFDFRATPDIMTFRELAYHILFSSYALTGLLLAGETEFNAPDFRQKVQQRGPSTPADASPAELASALRVLMDERVAELSAQSPAFFAEIVTRMDGQQVTRLELIQMIKEHELTHRSHMFLYLRLKGLVPATTRRRAAKQQGK